MRWRAGLLALGLLVLGWFATGTAEAADQWVQNHRATTVWSAPERGGALAPAPQWSYFKVVGRQDKLRIPVYDERIGARGWVDALDVGPSGPPPPAPPPPPGPPAPPPLAAAQTAPAAPPPLPVVTAPPAPPPKPVSVETPRAARPAGVGVGERWIEVDLAAQRLRAIEGDRVVFSVPVTTGKRG